MSTTAPPVTPDGHLAEPGDTVETLCDVGGVPAGSRVEVLDVDRRPRGILDVRHPWKVGRRWVALVGEVRVVARAGAR